MNTISRWSLAAVDLLLIGELKRQNFRWPGSQNRLHHDATIMALIEQGYAEVIKKDINRRPIIVVPTAALVERIPSNL